MSVKPFDVQGHRGARGLRPADTLTGFDYAMLLGVSTLEMDAEVTRDRAVVLAHDPYVNPRIHCHGDGSPVHPGPDGRGPLIRDLTLKEIKSYDAGSRKLPEYPRRVRVPGERIPSLEDILIFVEDMGDQNVEFCLEIKFNPEIDDTVPLEEFIDCVLAVIRGFNLVHRFIIQCFDLRGLELVKNQEPNLRALFLVQNGPGHNLVDRDGAASPWTNSLNWREYDGKIVNLLQDAPYVDILGAYFADLYPESQFYLGSSVAEIQRTGREIIPWTVNRREDMERLIDMGVDGIITDYPDILLDALGAKNIPIKNRT